MHIHRFLLRHFSLLHDLKPHGVPTLGLMRDAGQQLSTRGEGIRNPQSGYMHHR
jgi:hypothetical protein